MKELRVVEFCISPKNDVKGPIKNLAKDKAQHWFLNSIYQRSQNKNFGVWLSFAKKSYVLFVPNFD